MIPTAPGPQAMTGPGAMTLTGPDQQVMTGPGVMTLTGPGQQVMTAPGAMTLTGPDQQVMTAPGAMTLTGPDQQVMTGPGAMILIAPGRRAMTALNHVMNILPSPALKARLRSPGSTTAARPDLKANPARKAATHGKAPIHLMVPNVHPRIPAPTARTNRAVKADHPLIPNPASPAAIQSARPGMAPESALIENPPILLTGRVAGKADPPRAP